LIIVGPGVLGGYLGHIWKDAFPSALVIGLTNTPNNHTNLRTLGIVPFTRNDAPSAKFANVLFSAPPSGSQDYTSEVKSALDRWDGSGSFVFTSSMSVCNTDDGGLVNDDLCPLVPMGKSASTDKMRQAEESVLSAGGNVLRLVGLYHAGRGAHTYFLKVKEVPRWGGYTVNLIHYEDAARIVQSILSKGKSARGHVFIGTDNHPVSFDDMIKACNESGVPALQGAVTWTVSEEASTSKGKRVFNDKTREMLGGWKPKYESFVSFMKNGAKDFYS
jgi:nucleoside-diphosphate-sugar epimerase